MNDRLIEFRAWDKFQKKMISWDECLNNESLIPEILLNAVRYEPMQCTGLKDKNGRLVYEGDIVKCCLTDKSEPYLFCRAERNGKNKDFILAKIIIPDVYVEFFPNDWEVVGNIHENPEILEGQK